jgi:thioredoxin reductase (NADPH)
MTLEEIIIYSIGIGLCAFVMLLYVWNQKRKSNIVLKKIALAKEEGLYEPVSLHPHIDLNTCIGSGACVAACPEKDIIGIVNGKATLINASKCIGHGACFHSCPVEAISLKIGTEKRGVELPHINENFETNVKGIFIAGELGGMGLIKNSVEQGKQAMDAIFESIDKNHNADYDVVIIGCGPAGISASLQAKKLGLKTISLEQESLGGTVFNFPRAKIVMTAPMDLPLKGKVKLYETKKSELLDIWNEVITKNDIKIEENTKVESIVKANDGFISTALNGNKYTSNTVLLAIGRRGTPRKLGVPGEVSEKVAYKVLEPEFISEKNILVVGGGDSAIESAILLAPQNKVTLSYRSNSFSRLKPKNTESINLAIEHKLLNVLFETNVKSIEDKNVVLTKGEASDEINLENDLVFIFAGGELPTQFLQNTGIEITKRFGYTVKSHK